MEYCFLKGFLVVLLIQRCTSEGPSTSIQSSTVVTAVQDDQASPHEPELPPAEVIPVVAPPSLKEVQQAVQEASEQVEGRGAEEVLKELLERVVEAAMGQVEGGAGEGKADEAAVQEAVEDEALGALESETDTEVLEQAVEEEVVEGEDEGADGGDPGVGEEQEVSEDVAEEGKGVAAGETAAVEETGGETGGIEAEGAEVIDESLDAEVSQEVVEETVAAAEKTVEEDSEEQVALSEEAETQEVEETPAFVEVAVGGEPEQEIVVESDRSLAEVEQIGDAWGEEETQVDEMEGEVIVPHFDNYEIESTQTVVGEPVEEEEEKEVNIVEDTDRAEVGDEQGQLAVEGGAAEEVEGAEVGEAEGEVEESVVLVNEEGDQQAGEEEQIALETSHVGENEDQEVLVISAPEPEDGDEVLVEQSPENQAPTPSTSLGEVETGEQIGDEISNNGIDIITPTDDLLPHDPVVAQPTLDNLVKDVLAESPQAEGEANELVEDTAGNTETSELGLEAWKIGAISAAAFLVLETLIIIIYILKCRNKNSTPALQRACEEGCVEPEAATGGDCSDDTLPAGNGDAQQIAALDPSDMASTLAQNKEQHQEEHAIAMSDLPPSSAEESANTGPDPSQDLRTSTL